MSYYFAKTLTGRFEDCVAAIRQALSAEGFGVVSEIDVASTLESKLGVAFRPYLILGACNPAMAHRALLLEDKVGALLPCNIVVQMQPGQGVEVAAVDPRASIGATDNPDLQALASEVSKKLQAVIDAL